MADVNPQAVEEAKEAITASINENVKNLEQLEYKEVLEDLIGDLRILLEAVEEELGWGNQDEEN